MRTFKKITILLIFLTIFSPFISYGADYYDWDARIDRDGKSAGIYETTPYMIDETTSNYTIKNDEYPNGRTFNLGTKYYVDGLTGNDNNTGASLSQAWRTIGHAIDSVPSGNNTIIIRGAHDSFDGVYTISSTLALAGISGIDDTHRYMLVGYGQERPIIDGNNSTGPLISRTTNNDNAYITVQRLTLRNSSSYGINLNGLSNHGSYYFYCIDIYTTDNDNSSIYYMGDVDYGWIFHCTADTNHGHGFKVGDGASFGIVEWSIAHDCDWEAYGIGRSNAGCGIDFPVDSATPDANSNICRYNIIYNVFAYAIQMRYQRDFSVHHNEIYNCGYYPRAATNGVLTTSHHMNVLVYQSISSSQIYSNIIRDDATTYGDGCGIYVTSVGGAGSGTVDIYNNLIYGMSWSAINVQNSVSRDTKIVNNSIYNNDSDAAIYIESTPSGTITIKNNIVYEAGSSSTVNYQSGTVNDYNLYYYPNGSLDNDADGTHDVKPESQEFWTAIPSGVFSNNMAKLINDGPAAGTGTNLVSDLVSSSLNGVTRNTSSWDIGCYTSDESSYAFDDGSSAPTPVSNLRIRIY